jgi:WD40 repeat protein
MAVANSPFIQTRVSGDPESFNPGAEFSPDGRLVVVTGSKTPQVWDTRTGQSLTSLVGHRHDTQAGATFSPDSRLVVTDDETEFRVWQPQTGTLVAVLRPRLYPRWALFSPAGDLLVTSGLDYGSDPPGQTAIVWDTSNWKQVAVFRNESAETFTPDGRRLVLRMGTRNTFIERDARSWTRVATLRPPRGAPDDTAHGSQLAYSPDGKLVAATYPAEGDPPAKTTVVLRSADGRVVVPPFDLTGRWGDPEFSPDGLLFALFDRSSNVGMTVWTTHEGTPDARGRTPAVGPAFRFAKLADREVDSLSPDWSIGYRITLNGVELVDIRTERPVAVLSSHASSSQVGFSAASNGLISTVDDQGLVRIWETQGCSSWRGRSRPSTAEDWFLDSSEGAAASTFSPDRTVVAVPSRDGGTRIWRRDSARVLTLPDASAPVDFSPDGRFLTAAEYRGRCRRVRGCVGVWSTATWRHVRTLEGGPHFAWAGDGSRVAVSSDEGGEALAVRVYDPRSWKLVRVERDGRTAYSSATASADGSMIAAGRWALLKDGSRESAGISVWNAADGRTAATIAADFEPPPVFAPRGDELVTAGTDAARVWQGRSGSLVSVLPVQGSVSAIVFSPDGRLAAVTSDLDTTEVFSTHDWKRLATVSGAFVAFSSDDRLVLTIDDRGAHAWDLENGEQLLELVRTELIATAAFAADSRSIIAVGDDGEVRNFPCDTCAKVDQVWRAADAFLRRAR